MSATTQARPTRTRPAGTSLRWGPARSVGARVEVLREALSRPLSTYYLLLGATGMLLGIGLIMVLSASSVYSYRQYHDSYFIFLKQLTWVALALPVALVASRLPHRLLRSLAWPAVLISLVLLYLTHTGLGFAVNGNRNWLRLGPLTLQPSEIAKLAIVIWIADVYARKEKLLGSWKHTVVPVVPAVAVLAGLVIYQHDLGTALVLFAILLGMLWIVGAPARLFVLSFSFIGVVAFYLATTDAERRDRLTSFLNPFQHFQGSGWQAAHGLLGMASGGLFGKGLGASQQKWGNLPEAHTDFIFAVLGEELGMVGTLLVLALFAVLAFAGVRLALTTRDPFVRYVTAGVVVWLMAQMIINVGMVLALLPVIGIPLPLVSYGGSALLPSLVGLGLLVGFARREPEAAAALRDRRRARRRGAQVSGLNAGARTGSRGPAAR
ncbi:MAG: putative lipid II flippase FtsW [Marmoricola sp.]